MFCQQYLRSYIHSKDTCININICSLNPLILLLGSSSLSYSATLVFSSGEESREDYGRGEREETRPLCFSNRVRPDSKERSGLILCIY